MNKKTLALFDFDGTISTKDSFPLFIIFFYGKRAYVKAALIAPVFVLYLLKIISADKTKEFVLRYFFKGFSKTELFKSGQEFIEILHSQGKIKKEMIQMIKKYQDESAEIAVVSASADIWILPFCEKYHLQCICTELQFRDGLFTGKFKKIGRASCRERV